MHGLVFDNTVHQTITFAYELRVSYTVYWKPWHFVMKLGIPGYVNNVRPVCHFMISSIVFQAKCVVLGVAMRILVYFDEFITIHSH